MRILMAVSCAEDAQQVITFWSNLSHHTIVTTTLLVVFKPDTQPNQIEIIEDLYQRLNSINESKVEIKVVTGKWVDEIACEANSGDYNLLVLSYRSTKSLLKGFLKHGGIDQIIKKTTCSVILLKDKQHKIKRILLCDSGGGNSKLLSEITAKIAVMLTGGESVTVLHVMSQISAAPGVPGWQLRAEAEAMIDANTMEGGILAQDLARLREFGLEPTPKVRHGLVVDEILKESSTGDYDLIIIGEHPHRGSGHFLLEDLAHEIITKVDRPVVIVR
jgi:nucleotide-binding universal stress UspA family protein